MSDEKIRSAARFSRMVEEHKRNCNQPEGRNCVNWQCDGTRHRDISGKKWGGGWNDETRTDR